MRFLFALLFLAPNAFALDCTEARHQKFSAAIRAKDLPAIERLARATNCLRSSQRESLLEIAAKSSDFEAFERLVDLGADLKLRTISDGFCRYEILHVIQMIRKEDAFPFVKTLVDAGADLQSCPQDKEGKCAEAICSFEKFPLGQAAEKGDVDSVNYLADRKARIAGDELFSSAPNIAKITARLLELGADPRIAQEAPLFRTRSAEAVRLLVKAGADINFRQFGYGGAIPLAIYSKPDVFLIDPVIAAIDMGADLRIPFTLGTSWPCARVGALLCWAGQLSPTSLLALVHGLRNSALIDLEQTDEEGRTAVMLLSRYYFYSAGRNVKTEVLKLMIQRGVSLKAQDKNGKSVMDYWKEFPRENRAELEILRAIPDRSETAALRFR
ncbi:MAG: hypothetical protein AB7K68_13760 [Bacteriovoracia bacterium]